MSKAEVNTSGIERLCPADLFYKHKINKPVGSTKTSISNITELAWAVFELFVLDADTDKDAHMNMTRPFMTDQHFPSSVYPQRRRR